MQLLKKNNFNFHLCYDVLYNYLQHKRIVFDEKGYPILPHDYYVDSLPDVFDMYPITKRSMAKNPASTILCSFEKEPLLYGHIRAIIRAIQKGTQHVNALIKQYEPFYAIAGFDISVCSNTTLEEQRMFLLINHLLNAFFAVNGIKILVNIRIGSSETADSLCVYPINLCCCTGFLGCSRNGNIEINKAKMKLRLAILQPSRVVVYGKLSRMDEKMFQDFGMPVISIVDYNRRSRNKRKEVC